MSIVIQWATPDQYETIDIDVRKVIIERQQNGVGNFLQIVEISATTDGLQKGANNNWIDMYEDMSGDFDDVYRIAFKDAVGNVGKYSQQGKGGFLSRFHEMMSDVRYKLGDNDPSFYQLDEVPQFKWSGTQLGRFLTNSLRDFNGIGPMNTNYTFDQLPEDAMPSVELGVMFWALNSRFIREIPNSMKYNDGVSFDLSNRPGDYERAAKWMRQEFKDSVESWKLSHRPKPIGMGSQRLPFRVTRPLSMLPNMKNVFGF